MSSPENRGQAPSFDPEAEQEVDFGRYWRLLGARWWLPALGVVLGAIVGYGVALGGGQVFKATATIYLGQPYSASGNVGLQSLQTNPSTVKTIALSKAVDDRAAALCGAKTASFRGGISVQPVAGNLSKNGQNPLMSITVQTRRKKVAACAANALAKQVIDRISGYASSKIAHFRAEITSDERSIATIKTGVTNAGVSTTDRLLLQLQLRTLQDDLNTTAQLLTQAQQIEAPKLLTPASSSRVTARSRRNSVVVGAVIGLIIGALVALLWDRVAADISRRRA